MQAPARSLSQRIERSAAHSGAEKLMATAPASGIRLTAMTVKVCEIDCDSPRAMCAPGRLVENTARPDTGSTIKAQKISPAAERKNITSPTG